MTVQKFYRETGKGMYGIYVYEQTYVVVLYIKGGSYQYRTIKAETIPAAVRKAKMLLSEADMAYYAELQNTQNIALKAFDKWPLQGIFETVPGIYDDMHEAMEREAREREAAERDLVLPF